MKKLWMVLALWGALAAQLHAQWKPVEGRIRTQWSEQVNPDNVLPEYPRPIMERTEWKNLNVWGIERSGFFNGREKWAKGFENQRV